MGVRLPRDAESAECRRRGLKDLEELNRPELRRLNLEEGMSAERRMMLAEEKQRSVIGNLRIFTR